MNKRMLYIATPKSASTSIRKYLRTTYDPVHIQKNIFGRGYHEHGIDSKHGNLTCLQNSESPIILGFWKPPIWENGISGPSMVYAQDNVVFSPDFYKWTVIRNPWHRLASTYTYLNNTKQGCHGGDLGGIDFATFVKIVTLTAVPDVCQHIEPERYAGEMNTYELLDSLAAIDTFTLNLLGNKFPSTLTVDGIGCLWALWPYKHVMKKCAVETAVHTQRWENSVLFPGTTTIGVPDRDFVTGALTSPAKDFDENRYLRRQVMNHPEMGNISPVQEYWNQPHHLDKVIRFESLMDGIEEVCSDLGVDTWDIPHLNTHNKLKGKNRMYEQMYEDDVTLINAVRNWYQYEVNTFGYEFGMYL